MSVHRLQNMSSCIWNKSSERAGWSNLFSARDTSLKVSRNDAYSVGKEDGNPWLQCMALPTVSSESQFLFVHVRWGTFDWHPRFELYPSCVGVCRELIPFAPIIFFPCVFTPEFWDVNWFHGFLITVQCLWTKKKVSQKCVTQGQRCLKQLQCVPSDARCWGVDPKRVPCKGVYLSLYKYS